MFPTQSYACTTEEVAVAKVVLNTVQMMGQLGVHCPWHVSCLGTSHRYAQGPHSRSDCGTSKGDGNIADIGNVSDSQLERTVLLLASSRRARSTGLSVGLVSLVGLLT
jgi:hypothetical protein